MDKDRIPVRLHDGASRCVQGDRTTAARAGGIRVSLLAGWGRVGWCDDGATVRLLCAGRRGCGRDGGIEMRKIVIIAGAMLVAGCGPAPSNTTQSAALNNTDSAAVASPSGPASQATATVPAAGSGPFGLNLDAGPSQLPIDADASSPDKGLYILKSVPQPSSSFNTYAVVAFDGLGICEIRAISPDFDGDEMGAQVTSAGR